MLQLIDRRQNGRNKSAVNRERFLRRYKGQVREAVRGMIGERSIADMDKGGDVNIPARDIEEPRFHHGRGGDREVVLPGNREYTRGDRIARPQGGRGGGGEGPGGGDSVDDFVFSLSRDEFLDIFFDDLELPRLERNVLGTAEMRKWIQAGYVTQGAPCNLAVVRTLKQAIGRRIAFSAAIRTGIADARDRLRIAIAQPEPAVDAASIEAEIDALESRLRRVPFLDDCDLRYRNRVGVPAPVARAAMFCLMDVSASMDEARKDLAKRFFTLLYLFLTRKYERVDLVFVRHTDDAEEVDENTFFHDTRSGGTVVMSALELAREIAAARYASGWNLYLAQASDGDAFGADAGRSARFVELELLPLFRYCAYIEVCDPDDRRTSSLWAAYEAIARGNFAMRRAGRRQEIYPVFRELFRKEAAA